jgi:hypothetical protein
VKNGMIFPFKTTWRSRLDLDHLDENSARKRSSLRNDEAGEGLCPGLVCDAPLELSKSRARGRGTPLASGARGRSPKSLILSRKFELRTWRPATDGGGQRQRIADTVFTHSSAMSPWPA